MNGADLRALAPLQALRPPSPTLVLYVLRELLVPTLMGFGVFTFFLLMNFLLDAAEMIITNGVGAADVGRLFLLNLPHIAVLTVPMAVLVGGLLAFGRLSADSEIIAMRSGGVSLYQVALPILLLAAVATVINTYLSLVILPWGNNEIIQLQWRLYNTRTLSSEIRPRVFETRFPNYTLWVEDQVGPNREWQELLLVKTDQAPHRVVMAETAATRYDQEDAEVWMELTNGFIYEGGDTAEHTSETRFDREVELLMAREGGGVVGEVSKNERMMNLPELRAEIADREALNYDTKRFRVEVHKKFSIPLACMVMGLIALPLGISTSRHTKATGYLMAILVIAVYYQFIENGEKFAEEGAIPVWLGMWGANIAIGLAAIFLLWAKAGERDFGVADKLLEISDALFIRIGALWSRLRLRVAGIEAPSPRRTGERSALANGGRRFPRILDRYVLSQFVRIFVMALGGLMLIFLLADYFEVADDIYQAGASRWLLYEYLKFHLPFIAMYSLPIATVVSVLTVLSLMSKNSEVVAVLAGGTSLFRLAAPMLIPAVALTVVEYGIADYLVPPSNARATEIRDSLREPDPNAAVVGPSVPVGGHWLRGEGRYFFNYLDYDVAEQTFRGLTVYHLDPEIWRLARVEYAETGRWQDGRWQATNGWRRHYVYSEASGISSMPLERMPSTPLPISEPPEYFGTELRLPELMSAAELQRHIGDLRQRGFDATKYEAELHQKLAFPAVVFVMAIVGIPFGFRMGRQGTMSGIAVALALTVVFWLTFVFFRALGAAEVLPPAVAAWAPHALFLALAGYITLGLRT